MKNEFIKHGHKWMNCGNKFLICDHDIFFFFMSYIWLHIVPKTKLLYDFRRLEIECMDHLYGAFLDYFWSLSQGY